MPNTKEFWRYIAKRFNTSERIAKEVYSSIWSYTLRKLAKEGKVVIRGFGTFTFSREDPEARIQFRESVGTGGHLRRLCLENEKSG